MKPELTGQIYPRDLTYQELEYIAIALDSYKSMCEQSGHYKAISKLAREMSMVWIEPHEHFFECRPSPWIPVKERLPDFGKRVLLKFRDGCGDPAIKWTNGYMVGCICHDIRGNRWVNYYSCTGSADDITHWMQLPEAPGEELLNG